MKIKILILFAVSVCWLGCERMLEVAGPIDQQTADMVFRDDASAEGAVIGMYASLMKYNPGPFSGLYTVPLGLAADELYRTNVNEAYDEFYGNRVRPENFVIQDLWRGSYGAIYHVNAVLTKLESSPNLTQELRDRWMGEAYFLRALCYFYMVNFFGEVPLLETPDFRVSATEPRSAIEDIYTMILSDLQKAYLQLTPEYHAEETIRANKWAAAALKARVHLYLENWSEATQFADEVITQGGYELVDVSQVGKNSNAEAILQLTMSNLFSENNYDAAMLRFQSWNTNRPDYAVTDELLAAFEVGDERRNEWISEEADSEGQIFQMANKYKIRNGTSNAKKEEHLTVLRLAEMYLIRAEALAQQDQLDQAVAALDMVRDRAEIPLRQDSEATYSKTQVLDWILDERQRELCFEMGHRWFDLIRAGKADAYLGGFPEKDWQSTDKLFPIPQSERLLNPSLTQNDGY